MADHVDITLWIDRRWKDAIEKHLKGETLQEHLENVLDTLCSVFALHLEFFQTNRPCYKNFTAISCF